MIFFSKKKKSHHTCVARVIRLVIIIIIQVKNRLKDRIRLTKLINQSIDQCSVRLVNLIGHKPKKRKKRNKNNNNILKIHIISSLFDSEF